MGDEKAPVVKDRFTVKWLWRRGVLAMLIALGVQALASLMPTVVEHIYSRGLYYYIVRGQAFLNKFMAFSFGEVFLITLAFIFVIWAIWSISRASSKEVRLADALKLLFLQIFWLASVGFVFFLALWGLNYQRQPLAETWGLQRRVLGRMELADLSQRIIDRVNSSYLESRGTRDEPGSSRMSVSRPKLYQAIEESFQNEALLGTASQGGFAPPKPMLLSDLMTSFGVSGFYIPYTGEANFNERVPDSELPFVIAHEKAHQRGYAREDEANFIAFIICTRATEAYVRYSGYLHALQVVRFLSTVDPALAESFYARLATGPRDDLRGRDEFWARAQNPTLSSLAQRLNDAHLRLNRVANGQSNYNEDVYLIISYLLGPQAEAPPLPTPLPSQTPLQSPEDPLYDPTPVGPPSQ